MGSLPKLDKAIGTAGKPAQTLLPALLSAGRPLVMGILKVPPDSLSDGGQFLEPTTAITRADQMMKQGADIVDVGAESTRPYGGALPVSEEDEKARLAPVLPELVKLGLPVSIHLLKDPVACRARE